MLKSLQLLRNIGQFDSVDSAATIPLARLTLVYAENGRGKTTFAAVLRSLATGDPIPITERRRLAAQHPPHVVLDCDGGPPHAIFENGAWNRTLPDIVVFDDLFVDRNVYSGLAVDADHRQNLHEFVLGTQGVTLNRQLQQSIVRIEEHNATLGAKAAAIPAAERGPLSVGDFCVLAARTDIDSAIQETERNLAAAREQDSVRDTPVFNALSLPAFDVAAINRILSEDLPSLDAAAAALVQGHVAGLGAGGETWVNEGMRHLSHSAAAATAATCPFCSQDLAGSPVITHYRNYFSAAYADLRRRIYEALEGMNRAHAGDVPAAFEREIRVAVERRQFWSRFCDVPDLAIDTAAIVRDWRAAREAVTSVLGAKQAAPLDPMRLTEGAREAVAGYEAHRQQIATIGDSLEEANNAIRVIKEQAVTANAETIGGDLARLRAVKARHAPAVAPLCDEYLTEKAAKEQTERQRDRARVALDQYKTSVFPAYQTAVNLYLQRLNAGFRLDRVTSAYTRGGPGCTYSVIINNTPVAVAGGTASQGEPSFRNTLSSGDRNALALAFFFASLDREPGQANKGCRNRRPDLKPG